MGTGQHSVNLISSERVEGTNVHDLAGVKIGEIDHLMIDRASGMVRYAIMTFGGFLGFGSRKYPLPWKAFHYDMSLGGYVTAVTAEQVKSAPQFDEDSFDDRDWEVRLHEHFAAAPYWEESPMSPITPNSPVPPVSPMRGDADRTMGH
ncbi:PRC-barrel domain-containing protein [Methylocystis sp. WRRC1]|nr:PRC-barrel domain-containing protein [Methylocystis sp. WRRC1]MCC3246610.1 PRC-barrel domain-containing protein [Methylocystis sp. WRRC1]